VSASSVRSRIRAAFDGAEGYDEVAEVQRRVAQTLAARVLEDPLPPKPRVLEVGCGTGLLSEALIAGIADGRFLLTDVAPRMLERCRKKFARTVPAHLRSVELRQMDGEWPDLPEAAFDLIVSSLTFQWFQNLEGALARLVHLLAPGGRLVFATLGEGTFSEWRDAHRRLGLEAADLRLPSLDRFPWLEAGEHSLTEERLAVHYPDARAFVQALRALGANVPVDERHTPLGAGSFRRLIRSLEHGFTVTYHVLHGRYRRPGLGSS
jgi:malonyl-CoA O-methyltransferase